MNTFSVTSLLNKIYAVNEQAGAGSRREVRELILDNRRNAALVDEMPQELASVRDELLGYKTEFRKVLEAGLAPKFGHGMSFGEAVIDEVATRSRSNGTDFSTVTLLNTSILTEYGEYSYSPITLDVARQIVRDAHMDSAIGHQATAEILTELLGMPVPVNRVNYSQQIGEQALVFKLRGRPEEGRILNRDEIEAIGYDFGLLTREA